MQGLGANCQSCHGKRKYARRLEVMRVVSRHVWTCLDMSWTCLDTCPDMSGHGGHRCLHPFSRRDTVRCSGVLSHFSPRPLLWAVARWSLQGMLAAWLAPFRSRRAVALSSTHTPQAQGLAQAALKSGHPCPESTARLTTSTASAWSTARRRWPQRRRVECASSATCVRPERVSPPV